jgi:hypothetical protein
MDTFRLLVDIASLIANVLTAVASGIAIYVFVCKGPELRVAFSLLLNWSFQLTLTELKSKLERLNEYNANEPKEIDEIRNIFHEIAGQVRGNKRLAIAAPELAGRLETLAGVKRLSEPRKRAMISELRETLRNIEVNAMTSTNGANDV